MHGTQQRYGSKLLAFQRQHGILGDRQRELKPVRARVALATPATSPRRTWLRFLAWMVLGALAFVMFEFVTLLGAEQQLQSVASAEVTR